MPHEVRTGNDEPLAQRRLCKDIWLYKVVLRPDIDWISEYSMEQSCRRECFSRVFVRDCAIIFLTNRHLWYRDGPQVESLSALSDPVLRNLHPVVFWRLLS